MTQVNRYGTRRPDYRVALDGTDLTSTLRPRLDALSISSKRHGKADQLDLVLTDPDGALALPRTGVTLAVSLGWADAEGLRDMGTYTVDEIEHAGSPDKLTIRARATPVSSALRERKTRSWHATTVGALLRQMAAEHGLQPRISSTLAAIEVEHIDQDESDMNILSRLGHLFDASATVKAGCLIFAPLGKSLSASGIQLPTVSLTRRDGDRHRYHNADREHYTGVTASWHDHGKADERTVTAGSGDSTLRLRKVYPNQAQATSAAKAAWARTQRGKSTFTLTLATGRADIFPEQRLQLHGWPPAIDNTQWIITAVRHHLDSSGYRTTLTCETPASADQAATSEAAA